MGEIQLGQAGPGLVDHVLDQDAEEAAQGLVPAAVIVQPRILPVDLGKAAIQDRQLRQFVGRTHDPHPATAAACRGFDK